LIGIKTENDAVFRGLTPHPETNTSIRIFKEVMFAPYRAAFKGNLKTVETFSICTYSLFKQPCQKTVTLLSITAEPDSRLFTDAMCGF